MSLSHRSQPKEGQVHNHQAEVPLVICVMQMQIRNFYMYKVVIYVHSAMVVLMETFMRSTQPKNAPNVMQDRNQAYQKRQKDTQYVRTVMDILMQASQVTVIL